MAPTTQQLSLLQAARDGHVEWHCGVVLQAGERVRPSMYVPVCQAGLMHFPIDKLDQDAARCPGEITADGQHALA